MKKTCLLALLLVSSSLTFLSQANAASCDDYIQTLKTCSDKVVSLYGAKMVKFVKKGKKTVQVNIPCTPGKNVRKVCGSGNFCVAEPGSTFTNCYKGGSIHNRYRSFLAEVENLCEPIFASRQGGTSGYVACVNNAKCDIKAINKCRALLKKEKKTGTGGNLVGFLVFLLACILLEGLLLFVAIKVIDRHNPKNTILRGILLSAVIGACTYPLVYSWPLLGMLLSGSLLFGLIIVLYQEDVFLPAVYAAFHILWVGAFFTFMVAGGHIGNEAWLAQPKTLRFKVLDHHAELEKDIDEFERDNKAQIAARKARQKKKK